MSDELVERATWAIAFLRRQEDFDCAHILADVLADRERLERELGEAREELLRLARFNHDKDHGRAEPKGMPLPFEECDLYVCRRARTALINERESQ